MTEKNYTSTEFAVVRIAEPTCNIHKADVAKYYTIIGLDDDNADGNWAANINGEYVECYDGVELLAEIAKRCNGEIVAEEEDYEYTEDPEALIARDLNEYGYNVIEWRYEFDDEDDADDWQDEARRDYYADAYAEYKALRY